MKSDVLFQLDIVWQLFLYHCRDLSDKEAMCCKAEHGLRIRNLDNKWVADWPETEEYSMGMPSIAWTLWHVIYWWNSAINASMEKHFLKREDISWPGNIDLAIDEVKRCHDVWVRFLESLDEQELRSDRLCRWPFEGRSMYSLALWLNAEFMKNVAEIGSARFLYATMET